MKFSAILFAKRSWVYRHRFKRIFSRRLENKRGFTVDFSYSEVQQMLQDSVQKFVQKSYDFKTRSKIIESDDGYSKENWQLFAELGWLAVPFTEEDGGLGGSAVDLIVMMEEFGKANLVEPFIATAVLSGGLISELGNGERKSELLERLVTGKLQLACAYAEMG